MHDISAKTATKFDSGAAEDTRFRFRRNMSVWEKFAYFDHAAVSPLPAKSAEAIQIFASEAASLGDTVWPRWNSSNETLRGDLARLINADPAEIAIVPNTTIGIGIVAESFPWQPGDSVVVPANEFPSNLAPWRNLRRRGVEVREVPVPASGEVTIDSIVSHIDKSTRLVAVSWVGFLSGYRIDPTQLAAAVHERGSLILLDSIQGLGVFPLDVTQTPVDFLAADGHKWLLGPEGAGVLYIRKPHLELLQPMLVGWRSLDERAAFDPTNERFKTTAARYEGGSANMVGSIGFGASVRMLLEFGAAEPNGPLAELILGNVEEIEERLLRAGLKVHAPAERSHRSGILTVESSNIDPVQVRKRCLDSGVVLSVRGGRLRISTHAYNNGDDIEKLCTSLIDSITGK